MYTISFRIPGAIYRIPIVNSHDAKPTTLNAIPPPIRSDPNGPISRSPALRSRTRSASHRDRPRMLSYRTCGNGPGTGLQRLLSYQSPASFIDQIESNQNFTAISFALDSREQQGWLDITYLDSDLRIGRGNEGSVFVLAKV